MMDHFRKKLAIALAALIVAGSASIRADMPVHVMAAKTPRTITGFISSGTAQTASGLSNDELFAGYVNKWFGNGNHTASLRRNFAGTKLQGNILKVYDLLKAQIAEAASGGRTSTKFTIPVTELTADGQTEFIEAGMMISDSMTEKEKNAFYDKLSERYLGITKDGLSNVILALLADCPYELYWYDKTETGGAMYAYPEILAGTDGQNTAYCFTGALIIYLSVDKGYRNSGNMYEIDASRINTVKAAAQTAQSIADEAREKTDFEKLDFYRQEICRLTEYNAAAANGNYTADKNPWQLIYVFDNEPDTNVVCEGYAKAFQYLCDLTDFESDIYSYIVYGRISGGTGEGGNHMWNVVHTDGGNYLADITNCDASAAGDRLFLTGCTSGDPQTGYAIQLFGRTVTYQYDDDMRTIYSDEDLILQEGGRLQADSLHTHKWEIAETTGATCTEPGKTVYVCTCGEKKTEELAIDPSNHAGGTEIRNAQSATAAASGYTGDTYCRSCGMKIAEGTVIPATGSASGSLSPENETAENVNGSFEKTVIVTAMDASGKVTVRTGADGSVTDVQAAVAKTADSTNRVTLTGDIITKIKEAAGRENAVITLTVKDKDGNSKFHLKADTKDLTPGNKLYIYIQDQTTGGYIMVNSKTYTVTAEGNISVPAGENRTYRLVNKAQSSRISKEILNAVKVKKPSASIQKGKTARFVLNSGLNAENIKKITYTSSKKAVAKVSSNGKITAKQAGSAAVRAKVALKNGSVKTVSMKIKVTE